MTRTILAILWACLLCSCGSKAKSQQMEDNQEQTLILYYSQTGATRQVAQELKRQLGADILSIEPVESYCSDYDSTIVRWRKEMADSVTPQLKPLEVNWAKYSTIFLGFPIWGGTYALPIASLVKDYDFAGKRIVTFATFGSGGITSATEDLRAALPNSTVVQGYGVRNARLSHAPVEIRRFLIEGGYVVGQIDKLAEYGESAPLTDEEKEIFTQACGDYKFPLGEPQTVASRTTPIGKDYRYEVNSTLPDGSASSATIYVTKPTDGIPEFTLVDRH